MGNIIGFREPTKEEKEAMAEKHRKDLKAKLNINIP